MKEKLKIYDAILRKYIKSRISNWFEKEFPRELSNSGLTFLEFLKCCEWRKDGYVAARAIRSYKYNAPDLVISDPKTLKVKNLYYPGTIIVECPVILEYIDIIARKVHFKKPAVLNHTTEIRAELVKALRLELNNLVEIFANVTCTDLHMAKDSRIYGDVDAINSTIIDSAVPEGKLHTQYLDMNLEFPTNELVRMSTKMKGDLTIDFMISY